MKIKAEILEEEHASDHIDWDTNHWGSSGITQIKTNKNNSHQSHYIGNKQVDRNEELSKLLQKLQENVKETNRIVEQIKLLGL